MALDAADFANEVTAQMEALSSVFNDLDQADKDLFTDGLATAFGNTLIVWLEGGTGESGTLPGADFAVSGTDSPGGDTHSGLTVTIT